jgi:hypothetical protein
MMWCGVADFRYAGFSTGANLGGTNTLRELSGAVALELLLRNSGGFSNWFQFNRTLEMYVGTPDSLTFAQLNGLLLTAGIDSPADLPTQAALTHLQNQLMSGQIVPEIAARIARTNLTASDGRAYWRDGRQYQHNLAAVRNVIDGQNPSAWTNSIYNHWLACLRKLSAPTTDAKYPESMRTRPWAMKSLNTQLASWTQLRHNTALYVKESYTPIVLCLYPDGYVEPLPALWSRISEMALATKAVLATLPTNGVYSYWHTTNNVWGDPVDYFVSVSAATMSSNRLAVMDHFVSTMETLRAISEKELARIPFSANENLFLQQLVEFDYVGERTYTGWYPKLFYQPGSEYVPPPPGPPNPNELGSRETGDNKGSDYWDALVTTVHTDLPDATVGDPGSILHQAIGNVQLLLTAVDCGSGDLAVYAGPVLSHYEFEMGPTTRLTDPEWKAKVTANGIPAAPEWTQGYLVPSP